MMNDVNLPNINNGTVNASFSNAIKYAVLCCLDHRQRVYIGWQYKIKLYESIKRCERPKYNLRKWLDTKSSVLRCFACNLKTADPISDPSVLTIHIWADEANVHNCLQRKFLTFEGKMVFSHQTEGQIEIPSKRMNPGRSKGKISKFPVLPSKVD